ncbi:hypothetical protein B0H13DRAFT_2240523 [Mycena leptocephala]|nr:hypothetical protein B0H13DRAFT_2240523 [Mycena leptocephala]
MPDDPMDHSDNESPSAFNYDDVAEGNIHIDISHAGGEMGDLQDDLNEELNGKKYVHPKLFSMSAFVLTLHRKCRDHRTRWDATQQRVLGFRGQMKAMTDAYVNWGATQAEFGLDSTAPPPEPETVQTYYKVSVIDVFSSYTVEAPLTGNDVYIASGLVGQGLIPCSPWTPKVAVTICLLEIYCVARLRCPTLGIQPWLKTLADLYGAAFRPYSTQQFSTCFDVYLEILKNVDDRMKKALGRDAPDWRLKNGCPACTYKLEGEMKLIFEMLVTMDGNDSLKHVLTKENGVVDENGTAKRGGSERPDPRAADAGGTYFLSREKVDRFTKEMLAQFAKAPDSECQERWKNMSEELTSRMWGIFDETGIFLCLCRHGFVLLVADMVRSGELAKYGFAITDALLDAFGLDLGEGYDIGCGFETTIKNSPIREKARRLNLRALVGAFHGHAHNRMCQLRFLTTYVRGLGLEDLECCERFFSKSNTLSHSTRYASVFHRQQSIAIYMAHVDNFKTYANLSKFLVNNYRQALEILDQEDSLHFAMRQAGISGTEVFEERLRQEKEYLKNLSKEDPEETGQMEHYQRLVNLADRKERFDVVFSERSKANGTVKRHTRENYDKAVHSVQEMEEKMGIEDRRYRGAVNKLEELVVKRLFELTKMNMSGTGYRLRKHIAKALQTRSRTIRAALDRYNAAVAALNPPRRTLSWSEVIDFTFLADFDILRDPEGNAALRPWATPGARELMDTYFKIERAKEEIDRLNIEIRRLVTYIRDERVFLLAKEAEVRETDPHLAIFIGKYQMQWGRFDEDHMKRLRTMARKLGPRFSGTLVPGVRLAPPPEPATQGDRMDTEEEEGEAAAVAAELERGRLAQERGEEDDDGWETDTSDVDEGEDVEVEELAEAIETVMVLATDKDV